MVFMHHIIRFTVITFLTIQRIPRLWIKNKKRRRILRKIKLCRSAWRLQTKTVTCARCFMYSLVIYYDNGLDAGSYRWKVIAIQSFFGWEVMSCCCLVFFVGRLKGLYTGTKTWEEEEEEEEEERKKWRERISSACNRLCVRNWVETMPMAAHQLSTRSKRSRLRRLVDQRRETGGGVIPFEQSEIRRTTFEKQ